MIGKLSIRLCLFTLGCFTTVFFKAWGANVDTATTYSTSMRKNIKAVIIKPDGYDLKSTFPVVYLLHGFSGNYADWINKVPAIKQYADQFQLIVVCADGNFASWYFDSPIDSSVRYETYIATELVSYVDTHYKTIKAKAGRGITGLSMGGHGAMYLASKHSDVFGAVGSMSGGLDLQPFPGNWGLPNLLGDISNHKENWLNYSVINLTHLIANKSLAIIFDCGTDDFFYKVNVAFHDKLRYLNVPHEFTSRPGGHSWEYWANSVQYHFVFMNNFFKVRK